MHAHRVVGGDGAIKKSKERLALELRLKLLECFLLEPVFLNLVLDGYEVGLIAAEGLAAEEVESFIWCFAS
jgi:hypothetical protein